MTRRCARSCCHSSAPVMSAGSTGRRPSRMPNKTTKNSLVTSAASSRRVRQNSLCCRPARPDGTALLVSVSYVFVGEEPSPTARRIGASWQRGGLCATTLHAALRAADIDPAACVFLNLFADQLGRRRPTLSRIIGRLRRMALTHILVALGARVGAHLDKHGLPHVKLVHPAARGKIRKRERYQQHVRGRLSCSTAVVPRPT